MESVSEAYKDGAISSKHKRLMALVGAMVHGCEPCMFAQTDRAIEQGASVDEILEACTVAISLGGTMAGGQATRIVQFLREKNLIEEGKETDSIKANNRDVPQESLSELLPYRINGFN